MFEDLNITREIALIHSRICRSAEYTLLFCHTVFICPLDINLFYFTEHFIAHIHMYVWRLQITTSQSKKNVNKRLHLDRNSNGICWLSLHFVNICLCSAIICVRLTRERNKCGVRNALNCGRLLGAQRFMSFALNDLVGVKAVTSVNETMILIFNGSPERNTYFSLLLLQQLQQLLLSTALL